MAENMMENTEHASAEMEETTFPGIVMTPKVDIYETESAIALSVDMPGIGPDDVTIDLVDGLLTLTGSVHAEPTDEEEALVTEYEVGTYRRKFRLVEKIDQSKITASMKNGVLELLLPLADVHQPRTIAVQTR